MARSAIYFIFILVLTVQVYTKPSSDQYKQQADPANAEQKTSLHKVQLTSTGLHSVSLLPQQTNLEGPKVAEIQTGCADGSVKNDDQRTKKEKRDTNRVEFIGKDIENVENFLKIRLKRESELEDLNKQLDELEVVEAVEPEVKTRNKRNYFPWFASPGFGSSDFYFPPTPYQFPGSLSGYSQISTHPFHSSTQSYQVVIPVFGGRFPIFLPPQPVIINQPYPPHNRPGRPERPTTPNKTDSVGVEDRFGDPNKDEGDHPIWGVVGDSDEDTDTGYPNTIRTTTRRPPLTRPTKPPTPPLFHRPSQSEEGEGSAPVANDLFNRPTVRPIEQQRPQRPQRPVTQRPLTTTTQAARNELPRCTWAIITCCNPTNEDIRYDCFENAGCSGSFWGNSPCSKENTLAAIEAAQRFYESQ